MGAEVCVQLHSPPQRTSVVESGISLKSDAVIPLNLFPESPQV